MYFFSLFFFIEIYSFCTVEIFFDPLNLFIFSTPIHLHPDFFQRARSHTPSEYFIEYAVDFY